MTSQSATPKCMQKCMYALTDTHTRTHARMHTHTHQFNGPLSGTTRVNQYKKGKTNLDFTEARDSEWQWHQLDHMQVCTSFQTDNHDSTPPLIFLQAGCPSCRPTNSVKALKVIRTDGHQSQKHDASGSQRIGLQRHNNAHLTASFP